METFTVVFVEALLRLLHDFIHAVLLFLEELN